MIINSYTIKQPFNLNNLIIILSKIITELFTFKILIMLKEIIFIFTYFVIISFLILIKHSSNIQRLLAGNETKINLKKKIKF